MKKCQVKYQVEALSLLKIEPCDTFPDGEILGVVLYKDGSSTGFVSQDGTISYSQIHGENWMNHIMDAISDEITVRHVTNENVSGIVYEWKNEEEN